MDLGAAHILYLWSPEPEKYTKKPQAEPQFRFSIKFSFMIQNLGSLY